MNKYIEITKEEAKERYCYGNCIYICTDDGKYEYWKMPASYDYGSHAPAEQLFYRSIPWGKDWKKVEARFFIEEKDLGLWMEGSMPTYGGYKCSICGHQTVEYKLEQCPHCKRTMYTKHVGYKRKPKRK